MFAEPLRGGLESQSWKVKAHGRHFVVRQHRQGSVAEEITSELIWLDHLSHLFSGLVPSAVRQRGGALQPLRRPDVDRGGQNILWSMLTWVEGEHLPDAASVSQAEAIGALLAGLHEASRRWRPPPRFVRPSYDPAAMDRALASLQLNMAPALPDLAWRSLGHKVECANEVLATCLDVQDSVGLLHGDVHDGNLVWSSDKTQPRLIDFGRCGWGAFAFDIAVAQHFLPPTLWTPLMVGYRSSSTLTITESALPALRFLAAMENFANLSEHEAEHDGLQSELLWLLEQADFA
jgi:Ser/Thr protein kinase RdoA (MazF antagonist)